MHEHFKQILDKRCKKTKKVQLLLLTSWEQNRGLRAKAGYSACPTAHNVTRGGQITEATPLTRTFDTPLPSLPCKELAQPPQRGSKQGSSLFVLTPCCFSRGFNKALPEFLVWPLINLYWLRWPRTLDNNNWTKWKAKRKSTKHIQKRNTRYHLMKQK